ncbi:hypothetical protein Ga0080574_TMP1701 [Salipiger abyssi]|uniref:Uncharacterized protein n=1 Tax=Salipiger abyssi TaxID=1250539 RepID=A0A1P8URK8_9RHOB|nr:hypothetical protein Ga0080574_TMP1701 [Salipiger abyssi]
MFHGLSPNGVCGNSLPRSALECLDQAQENSVNSHRVWRVSVTFLWRLTRWETET